MREYREAAVARNGGFECKLLSLKAASVYIRIEQNITDLHHLFLPPLHFSSHAFCAPLMCGSSHSHIKGRLACRCLSLLSLFYRRRPRRLRLRRLSPCSSSIGIGTDLLRRRRRRRRLRPVVDIIVVTSLL